MPEAGRRGGRRGGREIEIHGGGQPWIISVCLKHVCLLRRANGYTGMHEGRKGSPEGGRKGEGRKTGGTDGVRNGRANQTREALARRCGTYYHTSHASADSDTTQGVRPSVWPISLLRFWISEGLTQAES